MISCNLYQKYNKNTLMPTTHLLDTELQNQFKQEGYVKLSFTIPQNILKKLTNFFDKEMDISITDHEKAIIHSNGKSYVTSLENICSKGKLECLELLGFPPILKTAEMLCGNDFFMIQEFAVIKSLGDNLPVLWHQDMYHQRKGTCFTMGIYIDDANEGDGALRVVPKSHLSNQSICALSKQPSIEIPMKAGEILIHDMMLAHCSDPMTKNNLRRVIYFEFLSTKHVIAENIYTTNLIERRTKLIFASTKFYKQQNSLLEQFVHSRKASDEDETKSIEEIIAFIYAQKIHARPSTYCFDF